MPMELFIWVVLLCSCTFRPLLTPHHPRTRNEQNLEGHDQPLSSLARSAGPVSGVLISTYNQPLTVDALTHQLSTWVGLSWSAHRNQDS